MEFLGVVKSKELIFEISTLAATIAIAKALDYETTPVYQLPITVATLGQTATATLTINVLDVNDPHSLTHPPIGTPVEISCLDVKKGDQVLYSLV